MIKPINNHLLIEPVKHETFIASSKDLYEEIGIVIDGGTSELKVGTKVYFDSWLASKFPNGEDYFWLIKYDDIRAVEYPNEQSLPK